MLTVTGISRRFGDRRVLDDVSFEVRPGRMTGFLGANGAGKTTTMRIILGVLAAHGGSVLWNGSPVTQSLRQRFGYMPEERGLYPKMKVGEQVAWLGQLHGLDRATARRNTERLLDQLELGERANDRLEDLSLGNQQRVQVAAALVHDPVLLILDEPFSGLDPVNAEALREAVLDLRREGKTIVFSTHDMVTAEQMCDRICMIFRGRKVLDGSLDDIQAQYAQDVVRVRLAGGPAALAGLPGVISVTDHGNAQDLRIAVSTRELLARLLERTEVRHFEIVKPSLADVFVRIARPPAGGDAEATA